MRAEPKEAGVENSTSPSEINPGKLNHSHFSEVCHLRTFALIVSAHPYCAHKFACHVMHERARLVIK